MAPITRAKLNAWKIQLPGISLENLVDTDGNVNVDVGVPVSIVNDEEMELEDETVPNPLPLSSSTDLNQKSDEDTVDIQLAVTDSATTSLPSFLGLSRSAAKKARKRIHEKELRVKNARKREEDSDERPRAVLHAMNSSVVTIADFNASTLPVASTGWSGNRKGTKPSILRLWRHLSLLVEKKFKLVNWDGKTCTCLVDEEDRIVAVLAGQPIHADDWQDTMKRLDSAILECQEQSTFSAKEENQPRGQFTAHAAGISFGGGRQQPGNIKISGEANKSSMDNLLQHPAMHRLVGFTNSMFNLFAHKTYVEYKETLSEHLAQYPHLRPTSPKTVFAATTINFGTHVITPPHLDASNLAHGWCSDTALGDYDPNKGGHLILWPFKLAIRFPPGSTILFPSALITHSNIPILQHEQRRSIVQYSASGLFRWRYNGWCSDKDFIAKSSKAELLKRKEEQRDRWMNSLQNFTKWSNLLEGRWKGTKKTDESSTEIPILPRPTKRTRLS